jgi:transglutaminase-like putative cysteine protease
MFSQGVAPVSDGQRQAAPGTIPHLIHYRVLLEPIGTNIFFLAPWGRRVMGAYHALGVDAGGAVYDLDSQRAVSVYEADSDIAQPSAVQLRSAGASLPQVVSGYLQLPPTLDSRIPRLATQISGSATNNYDKAVVLESYLKMHYGYTLQLLSAPVADPLANFLFVRKQGHCQYFASSMAVMLRTLHIPARVVNGFRSDEFNDVTGNYVVRAKNAHSWVEAYFPGYGWTTFDPTPGGDIGTPEGWDRAMLYLDAAQSFWREWVISYDSSHQYILGQAALSGTRSSLDRTRMWAKLRYAQLLNLARRSQRGAEKSPGRWLVGGLAASLLLLALGNVGRIARMIRMRRLEAHPERSPDEAAAMWYERMARYLARLGVKKSAAQTAQEFVNVIGDEQLRTRVGRFTDAYESARFGNSADDAQRLPELYEEVESAAKK